jgi:hypothetical protein
MRNLMTVLAFAFALTCLAEGAHAQVNRPGGVQSTKPPARAVQMAPVRTAAPARAAARAPGLTGQPIPPYSYFAARPNYPARYYWGYGSNDFPFYGRVYGRPYDLWTWSYMNSDLLASVSHYYYPPLGF